MHHQMRVRDTGVDCLDPADRQHVPCRRTRKLVGPVRSTNGDGQCIHTGGLNEGSRLLRIGQQAGMVQYTLGAMTILLTRHAGFQRAQTAQLPLDGDPNGMSHIDHLAGHFDVVFVAGRRFHVLLQRAIHHHAGEAGANRLDTNGRRGTMILMHHHRNMRVRLDGRSNQMAQESLARVFARTGRALQDHRAIDRIRGLHDGVNLLHVVDVERRQSIGMLGGMVQQLSQRYECHDVLL